MDECGNLEIQDWTSQEEAGLSLRGAETGVFWFGLAESGNVEVQVWTSLDEAG